jgi:hypothetical protein
LKSFRRQLVSDYLFFTFRCDDNRRSPARIQPIRNGKAASMLRKFGLSALLVGALLTLSPAAAVAREHGEGGRGYSHGQSFSGRGYSGGRGYYGGRDHDRRGWGDHDRDRYYRGGGFGFGFYSAPYSYGPRYYNSGCGYYDRWGYWHPTPCAYPGY